MPRKKREVKLLTLDTETYGLEGELKRIAIYDGVSVTYGYTFDDILPEIESYYDDGYMPHIYIHNLDFDLRKIPNIFERGNVTWSRTKLIGNRFARVQCKKYILHDSFKILPFSLDKLSKDFKLEHAKMDLWAAVQEAYPGEYKDKGDFFNRCSPDDPIYLEYLGYDVISLYELIEKLVEISTIPFDDFVKCLSTASMSKYVLKNGYDGELFGEPEKTDFEYLTECKAWGSDKQLRYTDKKYIELEYLMRYGFYGGRTEVFTPYAKPRGGEIVAYHFDVNSEYPAVMSLEKTLGGTRIGKHFPVGYPTFEDNEEFIKNDFENWLEFERGLGFISCDVYVPKQDIPPLPVKMGKLAFVCGHITGCWTYTELAYAIRNCGVKILKYHYQIHFKHTHPVFFNFVQKFYKLKDEGKRTGNDSLTFFAKLMLNTAYGWTCLRRDDKTALRDIKDREKYIDNEQYITENDELGYVEIWDIVKSDSIQVQIGAYVTSYARILLLDALRTQAARGTVYYCDTDSIVCEKPLPPEMCDKYELGLWDCEAELVSGVFIQPKVYTERTKDDHITKKWKGMTKARQKELDEQFYMDVFRLEAIGERTTFRVESDIKRLPSLHVAQKRGIDPNVFNIINKDIHIGKIKKRVFDYEKNTTEPHYFASLDEFNAFSFDGFVNPPDGKNLFGG